MPNWCSNKLTITGNLEPFKKWLDGKPLTLTAIKPTPKELTEQTSPFNRDPAFQSELLLKYGHDNWYDWNNDNWGTKCDIEAVLEDVSPTCARCR